MVYIFIYNVILYGCIQLKMRERLARCVALATSIALVFTSVDFIVFAAMRNGDGANIQGVITAFAELDDSIASQSLPVGAEESELSFPDTLMVTMETERGEEQPERATAPEDVPSGTAVDTSSGASVDIAEPAVPEPSDDNSNDESNDSSDDTNVVSIDVTWDLNIPESTSDTFDSATVGNRYVYAPVIPEGYTVAEGVRLPVITVTIQESEDGREWEELGVLRA